MIKEKSDMTTTLAVMKRMIETGGEIDPELSITMLRMRIRDDEIKHNRNPLHQFKRYRG